MFITPVLAFFAVAAVAFPAAIWCLVKDWRTEHAQRRHVARMLGLK